MTLSTLDCGIIILFFMQQFEKILAFTIFLDCFGMVLSSATIFWFRKKTKHLDYLISFMETIFLSVFLFFKKIALCSCQGYWLIIAGCIKMTKEISVYEVSMKKSKHIELSSFRYFRAIEFFLNIAKILQICT